MSIVLRGVMQSTVTPLKEDFALDTPIFERLLDFHVRTGATAISWPHHKGESLNLTMAERKHFAEVAVKTVSGRVPVSIHVSSLSVADSMMLARHARQIGADAIIAVTTTVRPLTTSFTEPTAVTGMPRLSDISTAKASRWATVGLKTHTDPDQMLHHHRGLRMPEIGRMGNA
jgi:dihydroorotate dehydrogenase